MRSKTDDYTAGEMRTPVRVQQVSYAPDGAGGQIKVWSDGPILYCYVQEQSAGESYSDSSTGRIRSNAMWEFTTWWRTDLDVEMRLLWNGRLYNIRKVEDVMNRHKFTRIVAEAGVEQ